MKRLLLVAVLLGLSACAGIQQGTITDKKFWDEYWTEMPVWISCGNNCTVMVIQNIYTPPCWEFYLKNETDSGAQCVEPRDWMVYNVGDFYRMPEN